mmetsp:Transcript_3518/g.7317  ORF Transcript_3518/g.7317 Transcript_3518/m.7317 type:complete len:148 (-) Transcript_3518:2902-3345(-)
MHDKQAASDEIKCFEGLGTISGAIVTLLWAFDLLPVSSVYCASACLIAIILISHSKLPTETPMFAKLKLRAAAVSPRQLKSLNIWTLREVLKRDMRAQHLKDDDDFDPPQHCGIFSSLCCSLLFAASEGALVTIVPIMLIASACEDL